MSIFDPRERRITMTLGDAGQSVRDISEERIAAALAGAHLKIVHSETYGKARSYILSESSLFLGPEHLCLVTCGKSTLAALLAMLYGLLEGIEMKRIVLERRKWPSDFGAVQDEVGDASALLRSAGFLMVPCPEAGAIDFALAAGSSGPEDMGGKSLRVLLREPRSLEDTAASSRLASRLFESLFGEFMMHEHRFEPQGYSANALSSSGFACMHLSPGSPSYASVDILSFGAGMLPKVESFMELFAPLEARLIMEYAGEFQERRAIADTAVLNSLNFAQQVLR